MFLSLMFPTQHPTWDILDSEKEGRGGTGEACVSTCYAGFYLYHFGDINAVLQSVESKLLDQFFQSSQIIFFSDIAS